jgi:hypothetical protein
MTALTLFSGPSRAGAETSVGCVVSAVDSHTARDETSGKIECSGYEDRAGGFYDIPKASLRAQICVEAGAGLRVSDAAWDAYGIHRWCADAALSKAAFGARVLSFCARA